MAFEIEERRVDVVDLELGMYVCRLDRPWEETPFPLQGLALTEPADIEALRRHCSFVYIDLSRDVGVDPRLRLLQRTQASGTGSSKRTKDYADTVPMEEEAPYAREALENTSRMVNRIIEDLAHGGTTSLEELHNTVRPVVESVLRNADAVFWIESLRRHDAYTFSHALSCSVLAAAFGRHMGFAEDAIVSLAAGAMLMDVGKSQLPGDLLHNDGPLDADEWQMMRSHVDKGIAILEASGIHEGDVHDIMRTHHERFDGSGYPRGLAGISIPMSGRMTAIIDTYDAMTKSRPYRQATDKLGVLRSIYAARGVLFQTELVEQFQACLGVYPTGTLVELSNGEIAVVMAQNRARRLRPRVAVLTDPDKQLLDDFRTFDLMNQLEEAGQIQIVRGLKPEALDVDLADYFLQ